MRWTLLLSVAIRILENGSPRSNSHSVDHSFQGKTSTVHSTGQHNIENGNQGDPSYFTDQPIVCSLQRSSKIGNCRTTLQTPSRTQKLWCLKGKVVAFEPNLKCWLWYERIVGFSLPVPSYLDQGDGSEVKELAHKCEDWSLDSQNPSKWTC